MKTIFLSISALAMVVSFQNCGGKKDENKNVRRVKPNINVTDSSSQRVKLTNDEQAVTVHKIVKKEPTDASGVLSAANVISSADKIAQSKKSQEQEVVIDVSEETIKDVAAIEETIVVRDAQEGTKAQDQSFRAKLKGDGNCEYYLNFNPSFRGLHTIGCEIEFTNLDLFGRDIYIQYTTFDFLDNEGFIEINHAAPWGEAITLFPTLQIDSANFKVDIKVLNRTSSGVFERVTTTSVYLPTPNLSGIESPGFNVDFEQNKIHTDLNFGYLDPEIGTPDKLSFGLFCQEDFTANPENFEITFTDEVSVSAGSFILDAEIPDCEQELNVYPVLTFTKNGIENRGQIIFEVTSFSNDNEPIDASAGVIDLGLFGISNICDVDEGEQYCNGNENSKLNLSVDLTGDKEGGAILITARSQDSIQPAIFACVGEGRASLETGSPSWINVHSKSVSFNFYYLRGGCNPANYQIDYNNIITINGQAAEYVISYPTEQ